MNKLVKGSIAGAVGVALLLGGGSTFALWNDAAGVAGGTVSSGTLDLVVAPNTASWKDISPEHATPVSISDISDFKIVPGDVLELTQSVTVKATGDNLIGELTFDPTTVVVDDDLADFISYDLAAVQTSGDATVIAGAANEYTITPVAGGDTVVKVTVTVTFDGATDEQDGQTITDGVDLSNLSFTLTQVRP